jgi:hypothetical protein
MGEKGEKILLSILNNDSSPLMGKSRNGKNSDDSTLNMNSRVRAASARVLGWLPYISKTRKKKKKHGKNESLEDDDDLDLGPDFEYAVKKERKRPLKVIYYFMKY